ncbi:penicillin-binding protein 1C [Lutibaculum baratangense]|uniref:peptidoglycan glycosyltransferase n=1 Tax=Lutibaculum baratangense AMV1 TaxID=631454 RepID=V4RHG1_9HYPH|nr:penicillin-binding protein 1C [Lutibaculum baratangense]ESR25561.1 Multimodular transpeptidase-transglycosylase [Lutibaculum baratangense AMV1]
MALLRPIAGAALAVCLVAAAAVPLNLLAPGPEDAGPSPLAGIETSRVVVDRRGDLLKPFPISQGRWRLPVSLDAIDPRFTDLLVAYEDGRFFSHPGVDPVALGRAAMQLAATGGVVSGGSTITMQLARLLTPGRPRSFATKFTQMKEAIALERRLTKREILTAYLTLAPYGGNLEGLEAASLVWFGHSARKLSVAEAALLIALPQAPEARRPDRDPAAARAARDRVLVRLERAGAIDGAELSRALLAPVPSARRELPNFSPHLALIAAGGRPDDAVVGLTLDRDLQGRIEELVAGRRALMPPSQSLAILVADHVTGEVLAEVGSAGFSAETRSGQVDMVRAVRSPGSALKPFIYGLAFEAGIVHPETLIEDRPVDFAGYRPTNFELDFQGTVTVREALQQSLNIPAVRLLDAIGPARLVSRLGRAGVTPRLPGDAKPGLPIALGGVGLTLDELVTGFAGLAEGGRRVPLRRFADQPREEEEEAEFMDRKAAWLVADALSGTPPPAGHARQRIAFKTGTSYGYRDAWSVGFDGRHVVGVWIGRPDGAPVPGMSGRRTAAPLLFGVFARLPGPRQPLAAPPRGTLLADDGALPPALRRYAGDGGPQRIAEPPPVILFPPEAARVAAPRDRAGELRPLVAKLDGGRPPFRWFANGTPLAVDRRREQSFRPDGLGFSTLTAVDAEGRQASVTFFVE